MDDNKMYTNIVFSGGSTKGIAHIGAIQRLIDEKLVDLTKIKAIAGSSAGSMIGFLIVIGFTIPEIWDFIKTLDFIKIVNFDINLYTKCGVDDGIIICNLIEEILTKKTGTKHINFKQLFDLTNIDFTVVGTCLTDKKVIYYNHINTPTFKVSIAIRISIGMPGYFVPVDIDGKKYIDGSCLNNYPMNLFEDDLANTIGIRICSELDTNYNCPEQYLIAIKNLFMSQYYATETNKYIDNTIFVDKVCNMFAFSFDIDLETKMGIYQAGIDAVECFIKK